MDLKRYIRLMFWLLASLVSAQMIAQDEVSLATDTTASEALRFPLTKNYAESHEDLKQKSPADLPTPENIQTTIQYDPVSGKYYFDTTLGEESLGVPFYFSSEE